MPTRLQLAETLITKMSSKLDVGKFEDGYEVAVKALVEAKIKNMPLPIDEAPKQQPGNVINLMDALRKSVGADSRVCQEATEERKRSTSEKHQAGQRAGKSQSKTKVSLRTT